MVCFPQLGFFPRKRNCNHWNTFLYFAGGNNLGVVTKDLFNSLRFSMNKFMWFFDWKILNLISDSLSNSSKIFSIFSISLSNSTSRMLPVSDILVPVKFSFSSWAILSRSWFCCNASAILFIDTTIVLIFISEPIILSTSGFIFIAKQYNLQFPILELI